jgi:hypothetical protein
MKIWKIFVIFCTRQIPKNAFGEKYFPEKWLLWNHFTTETILRRNKQSIKQQKIKILNYKKQKKYLTLKFIDLGLYVYRVRPVPNYTTCICNFDGITKKKGLGSSKLKLGRRGSYSKKKRERKTFQHVHTCDISHMVHPCAGPQAIVSQKCRNAL